MVIGGRLIGIIHPKRCGFQNDESNIDEDPKFITGTNQPHNLDEYKYKSYEELSKEFQEVYPETFQAIVKSGSCGLLGGSARHC